MHTPNKSLLVRADFILHNRLGGDRLSCKRWRRILADALPRLLGCAACCRRAAVRLHEGEGEATFSAWLRIPVERKPGRKRLRAFKAKLRARLEAGLQPIDGRVLKVGVRRYVTRLPAPVILAMPGINDSVPNQVELFNPLPQLQGELRIDRVSADWQCNDCQPGMP